MADNEQWGFWSQYARVRVLVCVCFQVIWAFLRSPENTHHRRSNILPRDNIIPDGWAPPYAPSFATLPHTPFSVNIIEEQ